MDDNPEVGPVRPEDEAATRDRILAAAVQEFVEHGPEGARMQRIAERSGANKAMIYYYFSSKQELYEQVFRKIIRQKIGRLIGIISRDGEAEDKVRSMVEFYCDLYSDPHVMRTLLRELASGAETLRKVMRELMAEYDFPIQRFWPELIAEGQRKGHLREVDPMHALASLIGMAAGYYFLRPVADTILSRSDADSERFAAERPRHIIDLYLNGILQK
ncbi:TetR/AcrR family transcriptional regulator [bacterium]|nr:TetR/AcrR family transcriptional regulator [bacterium]